MAPTPKQARFVAEYLIDLNASQAAIRAGYSKKTAGAIGAENLKKPEIASAIAERQRKLSGKLEITQEAVLSELAKIGFANMSDYMKVGLDGDPYLDFGSLSRDQTAALVEVTVEDFKDGRGEDARDVRKVKFKLADKRAALVDLGKHLGLFTEHAAVDHTVKIISDKPLTSDEWAERYATPANPVESAGRPAESAD